MQFALIWVQDTFKYRWPWAEARQRLGGNREAKGILYINTFGKPCTLIFVETKAHSCKRYSVISWQPYWILNQILLLWLWDVMSYDPCAAFWPGCCYLGYTMVLQCGACCLWFVIYFTSYLTYIMMDLCLVLSNWWTILTRVAVE